MTSTRPVAGQVRSATRAPIADPSCSSSVMAFTQCPTLCDSVRPPWIGLPRRLACISPRSRFTSAVAPAVAWQKSRYGLAPLGLRCQVVQR